MPRPRRDGSPAAQTRKVKLTDITIRKLKPKPGATHAFAVWDNHTRGLAVVTQPSGYKSFKAVYSFHAALAGITLVRSMPSA
jgi:hypothetical protein